MKLKKSFPIQTREKGIRDTKNEKVHVSKIFIVFWFMLKDKFVVGKNSFNKKFKIFRLNFQDVQVDLKFLI